MKKICHITSVHNAKDGRIFSKECCSLAKTGYEVYLLAPDAATEICENVHIIGVHKEKEGRLYRIFCFINLLYKKALDLDADIYHLHDPELLPLGKKLKRHGKKIVFDSHENVPGQLRDKQWIPSVFRWTIAWLYERYEKNCLKNFDAVISVNDNIVERLKRINPNTVKITNYPVLSEYKQDKSAEKIKERAICFAGGIHQDYIHHVIIDILEKCSDVKYLLAGLGDENYLNLLKSKPGWKKVEFLGFLNREQLYHLYDRAAIGVGIHNYTLNAGGKKGSLGGVKFFEFMMAGLPFICADMEAFQELVDKEKCGLCVPPHDEVAIQEAILYLLGNPKIAKEMGANGRRAIEREYNWATQERVLLDLYHKL